LRLNKRFSAVLAAAKKVFVLNQAGTLHGPGHWEQVERNAVKLAKRTPGCDLEVARLFAILHDCRRQNEGSDGMHGERAADFAQDLHDKGMLDIDLEQLAKLKYAMQFHNAGMVNHDPTIGVCWDADRLDLPRVGTRPVAEMLCTQAGKDIMKDK